MEFWNMEVPAGTPQLLVRLSGGGVDPTALDGYPPVGDRQGYPVRRVERVPWNLNRLIPA